MKEHFWGEYERTHLQKIITREHGRVDEKIYKNSLWADCGGCEKIWYGSCGTRYIYCHRQSGFSCILSDCYCQWLSLSGMRYDKSGSVPFDRKARAGMAAQSGDFCHSADGNLFLR